MNKLLRVLIVVLLVLSAGALILEFMLFAKREEFKGRSLKLADGVVALAPYLEVPVTNVDLRAKDSPRLQLQRSQVWNYYLRDSNGKPVKDLITGAKMTTGPDTIDEQLKKMALLSEQQVERMNNLRDTLVGKETKLAETVTILEKSVKDLDTANADVVQKTATIATQAKDVEEKAREATDLKAKNEEANGKIELQKGDLGKLEDKIKDKNSEISSMKEYIVKLEKEKTRSSTNSAVSSMTPGLQGKVIVVESKWGFVVLDLPPGSQLGANVNLTVQRQDQLIGKVHVAAVFADRRLALAEMVEGWEQKPVAIGDLVFF
ncbi:MAG: hypothetical protein WCL16_04895 [bacterium]